MEEYRRPVIDMNPDGSFVRPPHLTLGQIITRVVGLMVALAIGWVMFWTAIFMIPVLLVVGLIGYAVFRWQFRRFR
jgi:hypothetical protein